MTSGEVDFTTKASELIPSGTPLREWWGVLDSIEPKLEGNITRVYVNFKELEVLDSVVPYNYPIASVPFTYNKKENSNWGLLLQSAKELGYDDYAGLIGKRIRHKVRTETFPDRDTGQERERLIFEVVEIEGDKTPESTSTETTLESDVEHLIDLLDGKTSGEWASVALKDEVGKRYKKEITSGDMLATFLTNDQVKMEGDKYFKT